MRDSLKEKKLTHLAIERLNRLGFTNVDPQTLFRDEVYRSYFVKMLHELSLKKTTCKGTIDAVLKEMGESQ